MDVGRQGPSRGRQAAGNDPAAGVDDEGSSSEGSEFKAVVRFNGTVAMVAVAGELDPATGPLLVASVDAVVRLGQRHVVVDLDEVDFMDGAGLKALEFLADRPTVTLIRFSDTVQRLATRFSPSPNLRDASASVIGRSPTQRSSDDDTEGSASNRLRSQRDPHDPLDGCLLGPPA